MTTTNFPRRLRRAIAPVLLATALVACGGDDDSDDTDATDATEQTDDTATDGTDDTAADDTDDTAPVDGFQFESPAGDYTVVFPAEPATSELTSETADGRTLPITQHMAEVAGAAFATAELAVPEGEPYSLEGGRDGSVAQTGGELVSSEDIEIAGREGIEFVVAVESNGTAGTYISRILTDGETVYQVIAVGPGEFGVDDEHVAAFFDSFTFTS